MYLKLIIAEKTTFYAPKMKRSPASADIGAIHGDAWREGMAKLAELEHAEDRPPVESTDERKSA